MSRSTADAALWARKGVKLLLLAPAMWRGDKRSGLYVVTYHRVGAGMAAEMDVSQPVFASQMAWLRDHLDVVPLAEGLDDMAAGRVPRRDRVAVSFDDGYEDVFSNAWPILRSFDVPATMFVATAFVEGAAPAPLSRQIESRVPPRALTWEQLAQMTQSGLMTVGSHSHTHPNFDQITAAQAEDELSTAEGLLQERAGVASEIFAYPRGRVAHRDVVARHHRFALGAAGGKNLAQTFQAMAVSRTPARRSDGSFFFHRRLEGMRPLEERLYEGIKRVIG